MKLDEIPLNKEIIEILKDHEISELYPPQAEALPHILKGENVVLSIPTASGKSLVAYLAIVNRLIHESGKALYVVPLKALARELNCPLIALAQLNRENEKGGKLRRPTMADLRDSGQIEQDADIGILLHRPHFNDGTQDEKEITK